MRVSALVVTLATAACAVTAVSQAPPASAQECGRPHGPMVAYGHSYLHSPEIGGATESYAKIAASSLGVTPVIRAANGDTTSDVAKLVTSGPTKWVPGSADIVLIDSSINDILHKVPTKTWTAALRRMLNAIAVSPVPVVLLVRPLQVSAPTHPGSDSDVIEAYAEEQQAIADEYSAVHIVDASSGWDPKRDLSDDGIHPNNAGERVLARAVQREAVQSFCAP